ncbi:AAA family ATPase [Polynucleobacter paneuropaeus]|nr:AAA family ATPase [Polynucleobacter paneuropaeus]
MLLKRLDIENFRLFYGAHTIDFATEKGKSVTVFHGENGAGKTTLLNAIHWCLTNKFTPGVNKPDVIINDEATLEGNSDCFVELWFEDDGVDYRLKRGFENGVSILKLLKIEDGNTKPIAEGRNVDRFIQKIVPKELVKWFFFDGEAIAAFSLSGSKNFKSDLRETLGFLYVDKLQDDLDVCLSKKQRQVSIGTNDKDLKKLQESIDRIEHVMPLLLENKANHERDLAQLEIEQRENDRNLSNQPQVSELTKRRSELERAKRTLEDNKDAVKKNTIYLLAHSASALYVNKEAVILEKSFQVKEVEGKLPAPYSNQLVADILNSELCVCGRPVKHGTMEEECINKLLEFANTTEINARLNEVRLLIRNIENLSDPFLAKLEAYRKKSSEIDRTIAETVADIDEVTQAINAADTDEVKRLEQERNDLRQRHSQVFAEQRMNEQSIISNKRNIAELRAKIDTAAKKLGVNKKLQSEISKIERLIDYLNRKSKEKEDQVLRVLETELNNSLKKYLTKNFTAKIDPDSYKVSLLNDAGSNVGESTGEGQVLKFAFISTLIAIASKKSSEKIDFLVDPTVAPLVLDAPLSTLDTEYGSSVATTLAKNVEQLVLMGNAKSWDGKVEESLSPFMGKEYLIVSRARGPQGDKPNKKIMLNNKPYDMNEYDSERNDSYIKEIGL